MQLILNLKHLLGRLLPGDIIHAQVPDGPSLVCLITSISDLQIKTRTVSNQIEYDFNRQTGVTYVGQKKVEVFIDSITPVPHDIHAILLGLDRKMRLEHRDEMVRLTDDEKRALRFVTTFYPANQLRDLDK